MSADNKPTSQCSARYTLRDGRRAEYGMDTFCCVRSNGHNGPHFDHYGRWNGDMVVSIEDAQREMGIRQ